MKTVAELTLVETSNIGEVKRASIKTSAKMFNFFSRQIYTDFFTAAWRELVSNGYDGQKAAGVVRPVIVTVPSMLEPYAKVRDFGCSMTHDFMMNQFMAFGDASTKEDSNDFIGGFGIGSKAPLAYTEQYSIRCFLDGVVRVYSVFKDEEGCPSIAFLSEAETDEENGVEVGFPVRQDDIHKFTDTVVKTLQYFEPQPILENTTLKLEPIVYDAKGDKWGLRINGTDRKPRLIIGGVSYPLDISQIPYQYQQLRNFAQLGLDIRLDIGDANIALSREQVTHDEELFEKLNKITSGIGEEFGKQLSKSFDSCATLWEAKAKLAEAVEGAEYSVANLLRQHAYWKGQQITPNINRPKDFEVLYIAYGSFPWNTGLSGMISTQAMSPKFRAWTEGGHFQAKSFARIVIDDGKEKPALRIRTVTDTYPNERILFLRWNDQDPNKKPDWDGYLKALGSPPKAMIEMLSKYQPAKLVRSTVGNSSRPFKCYVGRNEPYRNQSTWATDLPKGGGMYIVMDNFCPLSSRANINVAYQSEPKNVVWLNKTDFACSGVEASKEWLSVDECVQKVKDDYRSKHKNLAEAEAWFRLSDSILNDLEEWSKLKNFPKQGPLFQLNKLRLKHDAVDTNDHSKVRTELLGVKYDDQLAKMQELVKAARKKHPLITEAADNYRYGRLSKNILNALF